MSPRPVLIDTDPGIDDAMALLFLRARPEISIAAVTTVFGNAAIELTTRNADYLAKHFMIDAPVFPGAAKPLHLDNRAAPDHVHGSDGLGDALPLPPPAPMQDRPAAPAAIIDLARANPNELEILALGPLTNLALALQAEPGLPALVRRVVIMGGAFGWRHSGNVSAVAEANIHNDPHAARLVLSAPWPVTMVGLDVTMQCVLPTTAAQRLAATGEAGEFLWKISRGYEAMYKAVDGLEGCCMHDVAAAACLIEPALFGVRTGPIHVVTDGAAIGQTVQRSPDAVEAQWTDLPSQRACHEVAADELIRLYWNTIAQG